jgi:HSP20 family molecular chaperone IbpA
MSVPIEGNLINHFDAMVDLMTDSFFNYNNKYYKNFANQPPRTLIDLPFQGINIPCVHYGGDYIVTVDETTMKKGKNEHYYFHFILPGHSERTIEVMQKDQHLIIKSKDMKEEIIKKTNPLVNYKYYKKVSLTHENFEVSKAVFNNGILSVELIDKTEEKEKINTRMIEVTTEKEQ